jgi:AcrR family transcriptional regulator
VVTSNSDRSLRRDAQINRQRIIRAACEVFATRGLEATFEDVASRAGVGIGTVYRRFPTKNLLLEAALEQRLEEDAAGIEAALQAPTGWEGLVRFLRRAAEIHAADRGVRDVTLGADFSGRHFAKIRGRILPLIQQLIARAHAEGSLRPDFAVEDVPPLLMMVSEIAYRSQAVRPDAYTRYLQLLIDGLRNTPGAGNLGTPLTTDDFNALTRHWLPSVQPRR